MGARLLLGKEYSEEIKKELRGQLEELRARGVSPGLAVVLVGEDAASRVYVDAKRRACTELGILEETFRLPSGAPEKEVLSLVQGLNRDGRFHGILVQLPLPAHISERKVLAAVSPEKDVDGFHPVNMGRLVSGDPLFIPATPAGIQRILLRSGNDPGGRHVVICGRSNIVGKPLACLLMQKAGGANATVTVCHTGTRDLASLTRQADILVAAMGRPGAIRADMVREGAVVVDVGVNRVPDPGSSGGTKLVGDVDFEGVRERASAITPVPGGVGPMTVAMLMANVVKAAGLCAR
ncbi:MAG: bifunctional 5,10-methylenetetrahydrofolate dehydrogenase/5,10-methenyltetrahydrofolate cyclohydrolase [Thermoplasmatota archaeon]